MVRQRFRCVSALLALALFLTAFPLAVSASPHVSAEAYCLMDAETGELLAQERADVPMPMASTTKLMTCLVALEKADPNITVVVPKEAEGVEGSSIYLNAGEEILMMDLLYALMLESANDAAVAIALTVSGSMEGFVDLMNEKACKIGMRNTAFLNPHGLPAEGHYSTARDMALLLSVCMQDERFSVITGTKSLTVTTPVGVRYLNNHNRLLRNYEHCIGGKTGFTKLAGRCLVTCAELRAKRLVVATLNAPDDWRDHRSLYDWGFSQYESRLILNQRETYSIPVVGGTESTNRVYLADDLILSLRADQQLTLEVELPRFLFADQKEGSRVGAVVAKTGERELARIPLLVEKTVPLRAKKLGFFQRIWNFIKGLWN